MNAVVVYESFWGSTAAVARAVGEGLGPGTPVLSTSEATPEVVAQADFLVVGAPVLAFNLPTERIREGLAAESRKAPAPPDLSHPSLRSWLDSLPGGRGRSAAFETRVRGPFGHATKAILERLEQAGYPPLGESGSFVVKGRYGPLRDGEIEKARKWASSLAHALRGGGSDAL